MIHDEHASHQVHSFVAGHVGMRRRQQVPSSRPAVRGWLFVACVLAPLVITVCPQLTPSGRAQAEPAHVTGLGFEQVIGSAWLSETSPQPDAGAVPDAEAPLAPEVVSELEEIVERAAWRVGEIRVTPYAQLSSDMIYATRRTNTGPFTLFVFPEQTEGESAFHIDSRRSRVGLNVAGPDIAIGSGLRSAGQVEIDFHGNFVNENQANLLLRHAYWELNNDQMRFLVGQHWDVISPLNPGMLNYSVGWNGGNIGFRRAQFRWERYWHYGRSSTFTYQVSLNQDIVTDFRSEPGVEREPADWPVVESRIAWSHESAADGLTREIGLSGHIGATGFDFATVGPPPLNLPPADDIRVLTWSYNVDLRLPVNDVWGFQGEFFYGANLSTFLGGIGQGVCPCLRRPIRSVGGWGEVWYRWSDRVHSHVGFGVDDPINSDSLLGRVYNHFLFSNVVFDITPQLATGLEVSHWKTHYTETRAGQIPPELLTPSGQANAMLVQWHVRYSF